MSEEQKPNRFRMVKFDVLKWDRTTSNDYHVLLLNVEAFGLVLMVYDLNNLTIQTAHSRFPIEWAFYIYESREDFERLCKPELRDPSLAVEFKVKGYSPTHLAAHRQIWTGQPSQFAEAVLASMMTKLAERIKSRPEILVEIARRLEHEKPVDW